MKRGRPPLNKPPISVVVEMLEDGMSQKDIAKEFGMSVSTMNVMIRSHGIRTGKTKADNAGIRGNSFTHPLKITKDGFKV